MKVHHAAALALVAWYCMTPTWQDDKVLDQAPLKQWNISGKFDTAKECGDFQSKSIKAAAQTNSTLKDVAKQSVFRSVCVSTDDPRLKK
jgi:hypothetical protein